MRQSASTPLPSLTAPSLQQAQRLSGGISLAGAGAAAWIAVRTHAAAPFCGAVHCPACFVSAGLAAFGLAMLMIRSSPGRP